MFDNGTALRANSTGRNEDLLNQVRLIVKFYIWPLLVAFGLTGNFLSILVLTRRRLIRTSTNNYLTILAAFDSGYLIFTLILNFGSHENLQKYQLLQSVLFYLKPLADFSSNAATWLIVCFTLERTLAVTRPIYARRTCSVRRSRHLICTLVVFCFLITIPTYLEKKFLTDWSQEQMNQRKNIFYNFHRLYLVFICVVIIWIPLTIICVCNFILIWYVHRSRRFDNEIITTTSADSDQCSNSVNLMSLDYNSGIYSKNSNRTPTKTNYSCQLRRHNHSYIQRRKVTIVLIFCLFVALILWTPQSLSLTYETFIQSYAQMSADDQRILLIFNNFSNLFLCINASIDFILYCFLSENFARTCRQIIFRRCSSYHSEIGQRARFISFDRTSFIFTNTSNNVFQAQNLAGNNGNHYFLQLYNSSNGVKIVNRKEKKKEKTIYRTATCLTQSNLVLTTKLEGSTTCPTIRRSDETLSKNEHFTQRDFDRSLPNLNVSHNSTPENL